MLIIMKVKIEQITTIGWEVLFCFFFPIDFLLVYVEVLTLINLLLLDAKKSLNRSLRND